MAAVLLKQMTEAERLSLLDGDEPFWPGLPNMIGDRLQPRAHHGRSNLRLGVPGVRFSDGPRGR